MAAGDLEAVVHVGLPKTGSTTIQRFLAANAATLATRGRHVDRPRLNRYSQLEYGLAACTAAGRLVDDAMLRTEFGLRHLEDQARLVRPFESALAERLDGLSGRMLISSEHLGVWMHAPDLRAAMDAWFQRRFTRVRYVMFVRPQAAFILSSYVESVKRGSARRLGDFVTEYDEVDIAGTVQAWREQFGSRVRIARMPTDPTAEGLLERYCALAGLDPAGLAVPTAANTALSARALEILRRANAGLGRDVERGPARRALFTFLRRGVGASLRGGPRLQLTRAQERAIALRYPVPLEDVLGAEERGGPPADEVRGARRSDRAASAP